MLEYLQSYADKYDLRKHIRFNTIVSKVKRVDSDIPARPRWLIHTKNKSTNQEQEDTFDAVVVCSGHFIYANYPDIPGLFDAKCDIIHSHDYRVPEVYQGKTVLMVGGMTSGLDITRELHQFAKEVILAVGEVDVLNTKGQWASGVFPKNVRVVSFPKSVSGNDVTCRDGETFEVDSVILCTGYSYYWPFLDASCGIQISENRKRVTPIFKHMIHAKYNTMFFSVLPTNPSAFTLPYVQIPVFMKILDGSLKLPSEEEMLREAEEEYQDRLAKGLKPRHAHYQLFEPPYDPVTYASDIASFGKVPGLSEQKFKDVVASLDYLNRIRRNFLNFREEGPQSI